LVLERRRAAAAGRALVLLLGVIGLTTLLAMPVFRSSRSGPASFRTLAGICDQGDGVPKDLEEALKWLFLGGTVRAEKRAARQALEREMTFDQKQLAARRAQKFL
jgi:hypothetical protein